MPGMQEPVLDVTFASVSAIGGRSANEDSLGERMGACGRCYVISDGAGGHLGGAVASRRRRAAAASRRRAKAAGSLPSGSGASHRSTR